MIKLTPFLYVHPLTLLLLLVSYLSGGIYITLTAYGIVCIHELFHLFAALLCRVQPGAMVIMPFGMTLRLKEKNITGSVKEMFIAAAGPFANLLLWGIAGIVRKALPAPSVSLEVFSVINASILFLNLLPSLPLDGGRIMRGILSSIGGYLFACRLMEKISRICALSLFILGFFLLCISRWNVSLLIVGGFLFFSATEEKKKNSFYRMEELVAGKEKLKKGGILKTKTLIADECAPAKDILPRLTYDRYHIIYITDPVKNLTGTVTETTLINQILEKGYGITCKEVLSSVI